MIRWEKRSYRLYRAGCPHQNSVRPVLPDGGAIYRTMAVLAAIGGAAAVWRRQWVWMPVLGFVLDLSYQVTDNAKYLGSSIADERLVFGVSRTF